jgi:hypothetical protein
VQESEAISLSEASLAGGWQGLFVFFFHNLVTLARGGFQAASINDFDVAAMVID